MRRLVVAVAVIAVALAGIPAGGHVARNEDPNDTPGKFDIRWTSMDHTQRKVILKTKVSGELRKSYFTGDNFLEWGMDTEPENAGAIRPTLITPEDFFAFLEAKGSPGDLDLLCFLFDEEGFVLEKDGAINGHVGTCTFRRGTLDGVPDRFRAASQYNGNQDNTDWKRHNN